MNIGSNSSTNGIITDISSKHTKTDTLIMLRKMTECVIIHNSLDNSTPMVNAVGSDNVALSYSLTNFCMPAVEQSPDADPVAAPCCARCRQPLFKTHRHHDHDQQQKKHNDHQDAGAGSADGGGGSSTTGGAPGVPHQHYQHHSTAAGTPVHNRPRCACLHHAGCLMQPLLDQLLAPPRPLPAARDLGCPSCGAVLFPRTPFNKMSLDWDYKSEEDEDEDEDYDDGRTFDPLVLPEDAVVVAAFALAASVEPREGADREILFGFSADWNHLNEAKMRSEGKWVEKESGGEGQKEEEGNVEKAREDTGKEGGLKEGDGKDWKKRVEKREEEKRTDKGKAAVMETGSGSKEQGKAEHKQAKAGKGAGVGGKGRAVEKKQKGGMGTAKK